MLLVGLFSIRYDASKGITEESYLPVKVVKPQKEGLNPTFSVFTAVALEEDRFMVSTVSRNLVISEKAFENMRDLIRFLVNKQNIVIYKVEDHDEPYSELIMGLINAEISFFVAKE